MLKVLQELLKMSFSLKTGQRSFHNIRAHRLRILLTVVLGECFHTVDEWVYWFRFLLINLSLGSSLQMKIQRIQIWAVRWTGMINYLQIFRSRKLNLHSCSEVEPYLASTQEVNNWLSDASGAKQLLLANWGRKLHWLKPCFHEDQERREQLELFREQLRRRSSPHRFYHSFHTCYECFH